MRFKRRLSPLPATKRRFKSGFRELYRTQERASPHQADAPPSRSGSHYCAQCSALRVPCTTPVTTTAAIMPGYTVDVEVLRDSIERCIMADRQKTDLTMTPRDLYVKSNPGLLGGTTITTTSATGLAGMSGDVTNPRDWYCSTATRKLLRNFVTQYERSGGGAASGSPGTDVLSKKHVAFYVNFPALMKEGSTIGESNITHLKAIEGPQLQGSGGNQQNSGDDSGKGEKLQKPGTAGSPSEKDDLPLDLSFGRMKSFMFSLPAVGENVQQLEEEYTDNKTDYKDPPPSESNSHGLTLPKLSKRTVTFNIEKKQPETNKDDSFEMWLRTLPSEVYKGDSPQLGRGRLGRRSKKAGKHGHNIVGGSADRGDMGSSRGGIPHQYFELFLPKHETELSEAQDFHEKYPWRQKSVLNLKLDFGKERPSRHRSRERNTESSSPDSHRPVTEGKKRPSRVGKSGHTGAMRTSSGPGGDATQAQRGTGGRGSEILGFFPHDPEEPAMMEVTSAKCPDALPVDALPVTAAAVDAGGNTARSDPQKDGSSRARYVYKVPADGFLQNMAAKCTKTNIVTLGLSQSEHQQQANRSSEAAVSSSLNSGQILLAMNEDAAAMDTDGERSSLLAHPKPKAPLKHYKVLEVFGERRVDETGSRRASSPDVAQSLASDRSQTVRNYKPMTRPPTYRLDERDPGENTTSHRPDGSSVTLKVKVAKDRRGPQKLADPTGTNYNKTDENPAGDALMIGKLCTDTQNKVPP